MYINDIEITKQEIDQAIESMNLIRGRAKKIVKTSDQVRKRENYLRSKLK